MADYYRDGHYDDWPDDEDMDLAAYDQQLIDEENEKVNTQTLTTPDGRPLAAKYASLGITRGFNPGPAIARRLFLLGFPGEGKSTFLSSIPGCLILDFEDSGRDVQNPAAHRFGPSFGANGKLQPPSWAQYKALLKTVCDDKDRPFDMIGFDTLDSMAEMAAVYKCAQWTAESGGKRIYTSPSEYKTEGAGWAEVRIEVCSMLDMVTAAGLGYTVVGHLKQVEDASGGINHVPAVSQSVRDAMFRRSQYILYACREKVTPMKTITVKVGGKDTQRKVPDGASRTVHTLRINTIAGDGAEKVRVPINTCIEVEGTNGWAAFAHAFETSVAAVSAS